MSGAWIEQEIDYPVQHNHPTMGAYVTSPNPHLGPVTNDNASTDVVRLNGQSRKSARTNRSLLSTTKYADFIM